MHPIAQAIEALFNREGWKIQKRDERSYSFGFRGNNNRYDFIARIGERHNTLSIYAILPMQAPNNRLHETAEFLHRANYGLIIGNFEMDFRDGEVRYKASVDFEDNQPAPDHINSLIDCALAMSDRYIPGLGKVIFANADAEEAIKEIEG
ncbi:MAG: YbjN domain-containing protein [Symbiobacteriaceae bacterium]|nr:YbjN domain-containing protein [Symbiobacteriaceae bacterium]